MKMNETKVGFFDVICSNCSKTNRTKREEFEKAMTMMSAPAMTARQATMETKAENAKRRGEGMDKGAAKKAMDKMKKGRK